MKEGKERKNVELKPEIIARTKEGTQYFEERLAGGREVEDGAGGGDVGEKALHERWREDCHPRHLMGNSKLVNQTE